MVAYPLKEFTASIVQEYMVVEVILTSLGREEVHAGCPASTFVGKTDGDNVFVSPTFIRIDSEYKFEMLTNESKNKKTLFLIVSNSTKFRYVRNSKNNIIINIHTHKHLYHYSDCNDGVHALSHNSKIGCICCNRLSGRTVRMC